MARTNDLFEEAGNNNVLTFPLGGAQGELEHFFTLRAREYSRASRNVNSTKRTYLTLHLPVPGNLNDASGLNYNTAELGAAGKIISNSVNKGTATALAAGNFQGAANSLNGSSMQDIGKAAVSQMIINAVSGIGDLAGVDAVSAVSVGTGLAINPHLATVFQGVSLKSYNFEYNFVAKNQKESDTLRDITNEIKYAIHPSEVVGEKVTKFLSYPDVWDLEFSTGIRPYLFEFKPCVMTAFNVNYNGQSMPLFFDQTNAPVNVQMTMTFQELEIRTRDDIIKSTNTLKRNSRT